MVGGTESPSPFYDPPRVKTRTRDQAVLFLLGYAWIGVQDARDLLELLFDGEARRTEKKD